EVRRLNPRSWLIYRPHPDVVAGMRSQGTHEEFASEFYDEAAPRTPIHELLEAADAVHVMTSLAGFEALLRRKEVVCHGLPFYAGWGLTVDRAHTSRRTRRLTLDELVAGVLIQYPRY